MIIIMDVGYFKAPIFWMKLSKKILPDV